MYEEDTAWEATNKLLVSIIRILFWIEPLNPLSNPNSNEEVEDDAVNSPAVPNEAVANALVVLPSNNVLNSLLTNE